MRLLELDVGVGHYFINSWLRLGKVRQAPRETKERLSTLISLQTQSNLGLISKQNTISEGHFKNAKPLLTKAYEGNNDEVKLLLIQGADVNARNNNEVTALMLASQAGHLDVVRTLLAKGADVNSKASKGKTALIQAAQEGHVAIVRLLLAQGANINEKKSDGATALMQAVLKGHLEVVQVLLDQGAGIKMARNDGETALTLASRAKNSQVVEILNRKNDETIFESTNNQLSSSNDKQMSNKKEKNIHQIAPEIMSGKWVIFDLESGKHIKTPTKLKCKNGIVFIKSHWRCANKEECLSSPQPTICGNNECRNLGLNTKATGGGIYQYGDRPGLCQ